MIFPPPLGLNLNLFSCPDFGEHYIPTFDEVPKTDSNGNVVKLSNKIVYEYPRRNPKLVKEESNKKVKEKEKEFNERNVKVFVAEEWTLENCLFKSKSLSKIFNNILQAVHKKIDKENLEAELATKLLIDSLDKRKIAYLLAQALEVDSEKSEPEIVLDWEDNPIKYLFRAIRHVCRD